MAKDVRKQNLNKLLRNKYNILNHYVNITDNALESIIEEDQEAFNEIIGLNSSDEFLTPIMIQYPEFAEELFNLVRTNNNKRIQELRREKQETLPMFRQRRTIKAPRTEQKQTIRTQQRRRYTRRETNRINTLIKSNKKPSEIVKKINEDAISRGEKTRTKASIYSKIYREKKKIRRK